MTDAELADLERLCAAAKESPGWWEANECGVDEWFLGARDGQDGWSPYIDCGSLSASMVEFLAASLNSLPKLIADVRQHRSLRVCSNCKLVGRHVESCNACGGTEFEESKP